MPKWRSYPGRPASASLYARSPLEYAKTLLYNWRVWRTLSKDRTSVPMTLFEKITFEPLGEKDIAAVVLARNELKLLPSFLSHYRKLGVTRFIIVDDQSDDRSREYLREHLDVDVWVSPVRYREAKSGSGGTLWREGIFERYGKDRWYLNIDADEYLVYDDCFNRPLPDLVAHIERSKIRRLSAPMIDLYPLGQLDRAAFASGDAMPWRIADHFDASGYKFRVRRKNMKMIGGPRHRKFGLNNQLMKYPLMFWDGACSLRDGIHVPLPYHRNFSPVSGVLLHFKFFADFEKDLADAISDGQYYDNAREYRMIAQAMQDGGPLDFASEVSTRYEGPEQLVQLGFMMPLWKAATGTPPPEGQAS